MKRFLLNFRDRQMEWLRAHSERSGMTIAEIIRRALDGYIEREDRRWEAIREMEEAGR